METADVKKVLGAVGVGATVLGLGLVVYGGFMLYKNYLQTELLKLQIADLHYRLQHPQLLNPQQQTVPTNN